MLARIGEELEVDHAAAGIDRHGQQLIAARPQQLIGTMRQGSSGLSFDREHAEAPAISCFDRRDGGFRCRQWRDTANADKCG